jgi:hypothetical protein
VSSNKPAEVSFSNDLKLMRATGILVNSIATISPYWDPHIFSDGFFEELTAAMTRWDALIQQQAAPLVKRYGSPSSVKKALEKTRTADRLLGNRYEVSRLAPNQSVVDVISSGVPEEFEPDQNLYRREQLWKQHLILWYEGTLQHRTLAVLKEGYVGLVPKTAETGDVVCILFGCDTPVVLRPVGNDFLFVGECYVHGIMDGELIKEYEEGSIQSRKFVIR